MFHRGEKGCRYLDRSGVWREVLVEQGVLDWPPKRLVFECDPRAVEVGGPYRVVGGPPPGVLAVLRRLEDGVRCFLRPDGIVEEVAG